ncbi:MAG: hypothetical protein Q4C00_01495 [Bacillota bacterium]|nr:hypothetical protein [Bacillota bacterium]
MAYADYKFYSNRYYGSLPQCEFEQLIGIAGEHIDQATMDKAVTAPNQMQERLSYCCCAVVDQLHAIRKAEIESMGGAVKSAANGGYSVTFTEQELKAHTDETIARICRKWLTYPVNLMLRWC